MRTSFLGLLVVLSLGVASTALAQGKKSEIRKFEGGGSSVSEQDLQAARRKALGIQDVNAFGKSKEPPEKPFPWLMVGIGGLLLIGMAPLAKTLVSSTTKDLEDAATFGTQKGAKPAAEAAGAEKKRVASDLASLSPRPASRRGAAKKLEQEQAPADDGRTPRDRIWDAVTASGSWSTADALATAAGLSPAEALDELAALVEEGYLQERRDTAGRPVFRAVS